MRSSARVMTKNEKYRYLLMVIIELLSFVVRILRDLINPFMLEFIKY